MRKHFGLAIVANHVGARLGQVAAYLTDDATTALAVSVTQHLAERHLAERQHMELHRAVMDAEPVVDADFSGDTDVVC